MRKPELGKLMRSLQTRQAKAQGPVRVIRAEAKPPSQPLLELLGDPIPPPTAFEQAKAEARQLGRAGPWAKPAELAKLGENPELRAESKLGWKELGLASPQELVRRNNALDKALAKRGKVRLTKAERKLVLEYVRKERLLRRPRLSAEQAKALLNKQG